MSEAYLLGKHHSHNDNPHDQVFTTVSKALAEPKLLELILHSNVALTTSYNPSSVALEGGENLAPTGRYSRG